MHGRCVCRQRSTLSLPQDIISHRKSVGGPIIFLSTFLLLNSPDRPTPPAPLPPLPTAPDFPPLPAGTPLGLTGSASLAGRPLGEAGIGLYPAEGFAHTLELLTSREGVEAIREARSTKPEWIKCDAPGLVVMVIRSARRNR